MVGSGPTGPHSSSTSSSHHSQLAQVPSLTRLGWVGHVLLGASSLPALPLCTTGPTTAWSSESGVGWGGAQAVCPGLWGAQGLDEGAMLG